MGTYVGRTHPDFAHTIESLRANNILLDTGAGAAVFLRNYLQMDKLLVGARRGPDLVFPPLAEKANVVAINLNEPEGQ